jgi:hypothetical protein
MYLSPGAIYTDTPLEKIPVYQRGGTIIPVSIVLALVMSKDFADSIILSRCGWDNVVPPNCSEMTPLLCTLHRNWSVNSRMEQFIWTTEKRITTRIRMSTFIGYGFSSFVFWALKINFWLKLQGFTYKKANEYTFAIVSKNLDQKGKFDPDVWIERIIIRGIRYYPRAVHLYYEGKYLIRMDWQMASIIINTSSDYTPEDLEFTHDRDLRLLVIRKPGAYISREWRIDIHV